MLLRFAVLVGGTHKARIIANLLLLHFGLAALNHYIEIGEIESDRQRLGVASDFIPWLIALSVSVLAGFAETFGVIFLWYLPEVVRDDHRRLLRVQEVLPRRTRGCARIARRRSREAG